MWKVQHLQLAFFQRVLSIMLNTFTTRPRSDYSIKQVWWGNIDPKAHRNKRTRPVWTTHLKLLHHRKSRTQTGCVPCVYDYYYEQLAKWEKQYKPSDNKDDKRSW